MVSDELMDGYLELFQPPGPDEPGVTVVSGGDG